MWINSTSESNSSDSIAAFTISWFNSSDFQSTSTKQDETESNLFPLPVYLLVEKDGIEHKLGAGLIVGHNHILTSEDVANRIDSQDLETVIEVSVVGSADNVKTLLSQKSIQAEASPSTFTFVDGDNKHVVYLHDDNKTKYSFDYAANDLPNYEQQPGNSSAKLNLNECDNKSIEWSSRMLSSSRANLTSDDAEYLQ